MCKSFDLIFSSVYETFILIVSGNTFFLLMTKLDLHGGLKVFNRYHRSIIRVKSIFEPCLIFLSEFLSFFESLPGGRSSQPINIDRFLVEPVYRMVIFYQFLSLLISLKKSIIFGPNGSLV